MTYLSLLEELLNVEKQEQKHQSEETKIKLSRLPHYKILEEFSILH